VGAILSGSSNVSFNCEIAEKRLNLQGNHFLEVAAYRETICNDESTGCSNLWYNYG
jgi:hypothetical protein